MKQLECKLCGNIVHDDIFSDNCRITEVQFTNYNDTTYIVNIGAYLCLSCSKNLENILEKLDITIEER